MKSTVVFQREVIDGRVFLIFAGAIIRTTKPKDAHLEPGEFCAAEPTVQQWRHGETGTVRFRTPNAGDGWRTQVMNPLSLIWRIVTVPYHPQTDDRSFLNRSTTETKSNLTVEAVALSEAESHRVFGVRMAHRGIQPVWLRIANGSDKPHRLDLLSIDPGYFTPLEAAYVSHFALAKRLLSFGLLAWVFVLLIPLVPFKLFGARAANKRMNDVFKKLGFHPGPIRPATERSGFVFTGVDEGIKNIDLKLVSADTLVDFGFSLDVPGLKLDSADDASFESAGLQGLDEGAFRDWLEARPRCTSNRKGNVEGDPLNLVVVGNRATVLRCFGARWDEVESIDISTSLKTFKAFLFDSEYRYSPVSPLFLEGNRQEFALQKARASINERIHLRLWRTSISFAGQPVWLGQCSRDIGVRYTTKTWNLTTHKIDPDVDEARDYVIDDLVAAGRVSRVGYAHGVGPAPESDPRHNLTGDPYFTDGLRAVVILSKTRTQSAFLDWANG